MLGGAHTSRGVPYLLAVVQFLPQLRLTFISGSAGELSGVMYAIQVVGGYVICANLIFLEHETGRLGRR